MWEMHLNAIFLEIMKMSIYIYICKLHKEYILQLYLSWASLVARVHHAHICQIGHQGGHCVYLKCVASQISILQESCLRSPALSTQRTSTDEYGYLSAKSKVSRFLSPYWLWEFSWRCLLLYAKDHENALCLAVSPLSTLQCLYACHLQKLRHANHNLWGIQNII